MPPIDDEIEDVINRNGQSSPKSQPITGEVIPPPRASSPSRHEPPVENLPSAPPTHVETSFFGLFADPNDLAHRETQKDTERATREYFYVEVTTRAMAVHHTRQTKWAVSEIERIASDTPPNTLVRRAMIDLAAGLAPILVSNAIDSPQNYRETQIARLNNRWSR